MSDYRVGYLPLSHTEYKKLRRKEKIKKILKLFIIVSILFAAYEILLK